MSVTYGFYNSVNNDRKYNATQMSSLFDGIINDGVFMSVGDALIVTAMSGMNVSVGEGRAWFNRTWTNNDAPLVLTLDASEIVLNRIDRIVLEVNSDDAVRANVIKIVKGAPASSPVAPALVSTEFVHQYPLCDIYVGAGVTSINQGNITNKIGTSECPFVTGILETVNIDDLLLQWNAEFQVWFASIQGILDGNIAANLLNLINEHKEDYVAQPANGGTTTGTAIAYTCTSTPAPATIVDKMGVVITAHVNSGSNPTLNWNALGAKPIKKPNGNAAVLKNGGVYTLRYNATTANFILQGEGASGNAVASDLLSGKTASTDAGDITGTMTDRGAVNITPSTANQTIQAGYHDGAGVVYGDADLTASNIKNGVNIFGVVGTANGYANVNAGANVIASRGAFLKNVNMNTINTIWTITANTPGTYRCSTTISSIPVNGAGNFGLYVNDVLVRSLGIYSQFGTYPVTLTADITVTAGQTIKLKNNTTGYTDANSTNSFSGVTVGIAETPITSAIS